MLLGKQVSGNMLRYGSIATSREYVQSCIALFSDAMETRAQKVSHTLYLYCISSSHSHPQDLSKNPSLLSEMSAPLKGSEKRDRKRNARQAERKTAEIKYLDVPQVICYG